MSVGSLFNTIKTCTERTSKELARPPTFNKRQWTRLLRCFPDTLSSTMLLRWRNSALESKLGHSWNLGISSGGVRGHGRELLRGSLAT